jgi:xanthine dehydrogenase/oxidase
MGSVLSVENTVPFVLLISFLVVYNVVVWLLKPSDTTQTSSGFSALTTLKSSEIPWSNELTFVLNGSTVKLVNPDPEELLATYIRDKAGLKGTKLGCEEGGCGACTVVLSKPDGTISVNSCLRPLCTNDGMAITTVEGIGSISGGMSSEQESIVKHNGTQCGFCTPGWISNMHARNMATEEGTKPAISGGDIDQYFDGNICRCTGYKPILTAFKESASSSSCGGDGSCKVTGICSSTRKASCHTSIEDIGSHGDHHHHPSSASWAGRKSSPLGGRRQLAQLGNYTPQPLHFYGSQSHTHWYRPVDLSQLSAVLKEYQQDGAACVQLVGGNTSIGVTKYFNGTAPYNTQDKYSVFIDINNIPQLSEQTYDPSSKILRAGASLTLTELIELLNSNANRPTNSDTGEVDHHSVFSVTAHHLRRIANTQVRNAGTWAGNLGIFKRHSTFPSDAVLALTTANAVLTICDADGTIRQMNMSEFLQVTHTAFIHSFIHSFIHLT